MEISTQIPPIGEVAKIYELHNNLKKDQETVTKPKENNEEIKKLGDEVAQEVYKQATGNGGLLNKKI